MAKFILSAFADESADSLSEQIEALKENGICYIEPRSIDGKNIIDLTDGELLSVRKSLDERGIKVGSLGSPIGKFDIKKPFAEHLCDLKRALTACNILGTDKMRMFSFFVDTEELTEYRSEVMKRLNAMGELARDYGVTLCHENESGIYGQMPSEVADILDNVPYIKAVFDPANYRMNDADINEGLNATLKRLAYLHIKDAIYKEQMIVPAGEGEGNIPEVIERVNAATDDVVFLTVEPHLALFSAYKDIDEHVLKGKYVFNSNKESFSFAVNALKNILKNLGYERNEENVWIK